MPPPILIIDCDPQVQLQLAPALRQAGQQPLWAPDAEHALRMLESETPALLLLEWNLPGQCGLALLRRLRALPRTAGLPVIMLTARSAEADKILALESGADDYITKPFSPRETLARVHAVLRRQAHAAARDGEVTAAVDGTMLHAAALRLDAATQRVVAGGQQLSLGRVEFRLLHLLMQHPERVYSRAQLLDLVWGADACLDERTVDAHVGRLRSALHPSGHHEYIQTVRGSGYRFTVCPALLHPRPQQQAPQIQPLQPLQQISPLPPTPQLPPMSPMPEPGCFALSGMPQRPGARQAYFMELRPPQLRFALARRDAAPAAAPPERAVSRREMEILHWVREGKSNTEVGQILGISGLTVKNHLQRIYKTLGVSNRAQAVARGIALRLLDASAARA